MPINQNPLEQRQLIEQLSDEQILAELQKPQNSSPLPQYQLALAMTKREGQRKAAKAAMNARNAQDGTVKDRIIAKYQAINRPQQVPQAQPQQAPQPQGLGLARGGSVTRRPDNSNPISNYASGGPVVGYQHAGPVSRVDALRKQELEEAMRLRQVLQDEPDGLEAIRRRREMESQRAYRDPIEMRQMLARERQALGPAAQSVFDAGVVNQPPPPAAGQGPSMDIPERPTWLGTERIEAIGDAVRGSEAYEMGEIIGDIGGSLAGTVSGSSRRQPEIHGALPLDQSIHPAPTDMGLEELADKSDGMMDYDAEIMPPPDPGESQEEKTARYAKGLALLRAADAAANNTGNAIQIMTGAALAYGETMSAADAKLVAGNQARAAAEQKAKIDMIKIDVEKQKVASKVINGSLDRIEDRRAAAVTLAENMIDPDGGPMYEQYEGTADEEKEAYFKSLVQDYLRWMNGLTTRPTATPMQ